MANKATTYTWDQWAALPALPVVGDEPCPRDPLQSKRSVLRGTFGLLAFCLLLFLVGVYLYPRTSFAVPAGMENMQADEVSEHVKQAAANSDVAAWALQEKHRLNALAVMMAGFLLALVLSYGCSPSLPLGPALSHRNEIRGVYLPYLHGADGSGPVMSMERAAAYVNALIPVEQARLQEFESGPDGPPSIADLRSIANSLPPNRWVRESPTVWVYAVNEIGEAPPNEI